MNTLEKIAEQFPRHEGKFNKLVESIETQETLADSLKAKLDKIGDTPIDEPKIYEVVSDQVALARLLLTEDEIVKQYSAAEVANFLYSVHQKVTEVRGDDGIFKSTPNTENCVLPNFIEVDELMKQGRERHALESALKKAKTQKSKAELAEKFKQLEEESSRRTFEISGLREEDLTEWEKVLVITQIHTVSIDATLSSVGKHL